MGNAEWVAETDPDARIARMKDGRTHLAYKAEHVVDLRSDLVLAAEVVPADHGDAATLVDSVTAARVNLAAAGLPDAMAAISAPISRSRPTGPGWSAKDEYCEAFSGTGRGAGAPRGVVGWYIGRPDTTER